MHRLLRASIATIALSISVFGLVSCTSGDTESASGSDTSSETPPTAPIEESIIGVWGDPSAQGKTSLEFTEDGRYSGTDGCNRVGGSWEAESERALLGPMVSTMMACEGVDTWLIDPDTATVSGDTLVIADKAGNELGTLDRV